MIVNLTHLANAFGSDKGNEIGLAHNYTQCYSFLFEQFRLQTFSMLEIGLQRGGKDQELLRSRVGNDIPSVNMWRLYFPNAMIYGFDISDFSSYANIQQFIPIQGDMGNLSDLLSLRLQLPKLKIILDDASHASYHQQLAFVTLWDRLESGGFYIFEDLHSHHPIEKQLPSCRRTASVITEYNLGKLLDIPFADEEALSKIENSIRRVYIQRASPSFGSVIKMAVVEKK